MRKRKEKSEWILNPYNDKLKKSYLHGWGYIEIDGVEYSPDEYITMLEEANKDLKEKIRRLEFDVDAWYQLKLLLEWEIERLKETIKDHQLYEEKLEHRIIEFEELLHWE